MLTATAYAGERDEQTEDCESRRHEGCFVSKRRIQSVKNLATAKQGRTQVKENQPEEEEDCEPPRKIKTRSQQVSCVCYTAKIVANVANQVDRLLRFPPCIFLHFVLKNYIPESK